MPILDNLFLPVEVLESIKSAATHASINSCGARGTPDSSPSVKTWTLLKTSSMARVYRVKFIELGLQGYKDLHLIENLPAIFIIHQVELGLGLGVGLVGDLDTFVSRHSPNPKTLLTLTLTLIGDLPDSSISNHCPCNVFPNPFSSGPTRDDKPLDLRHHNIDIH